MAAYTAGIPLLRDPDAKAAKQFLDEELAAHGRAAVADQGGGRQAPLRGSSYDLGHPGDVPRCWRCCTGSSGRRSPPTWARSRLSPGPVRAAVASILANDAQHLAILRLAQGDDRVPSAFVTGSE